MAKCDEGYICEICGEDVARIVDSDLYLRYVLGWVDAETLHTTPERHIRCNPSIAQFIVDDEFPPVVLEGPFDKRQLDEESVRQREQQLTRAWRRLKDLEQREGMSLLEYPLEDVLARLRDQV